MTIWTDELDALVTRLWHQGLTGAQMSFRIPNSTSEGCMERCRKLGLRRGSNPVKSAWSETDDEILTLMWTNGSSASQIAKALPGDRTRNAVIGRANRLGLRKTSPERNRNPKVKIERKAPPRRAPRPQRNWTQKSSSIPPESARKALLALNTHDCRWPMGDPQEPGFGFCGARQEPGLPYCPHHAQVAYRPEQPREVELHRRRAA